MSKGADQNDNNKNPVPYHLSGLWELKFKNFQEHHLGFQLLAEESEISLARGFFPAPHFPPQHIPCARRWGFVTLCCLYTLHPVARINSIKFIKQLGLGEQFQIKPQWKSSELLKQIHPRWVCAPRALVSHMDSSHMGGQRQKRVEGWI